MLCCAATLAARDNKHIREHRKMAREIFCILKGLEKIANAKFQWRGCESIVRLLFF
jgi:hypothetical protein